MNFKKHFPKSLANASFFNKLKQHQSFSTSYIEQSSVYLHWPYCRKQCSYCNFVKFIPKKGSSWTFPNETIIDSLVKELQWSLNCSSIKRINSVYFGGGTPSLAGPQLVEKTLHELSKLVDLSSGLEVTLEANPYDFQKTEVEQFKSSGVNRISLGVQSLSDKNLNFLNRDHTRKMALDCIEMVKEHFPGKVSLDFIFGLPDQTLDEVEKELGEIISIADDHLSLYQLTLERGTPIYQDIRAGKLQMLPEDIQADMYLSIISLLKQNGFHRYEVSNFSRNPEAESLHNKGYWSGQQYLGIGPGAHGRVVSTVDGKPHKEARVNAPDPQNWLKYVDNHGHSIRKRVQQTTQAVLEEYLVMSLRTVQGCNADRWLDLCDGNCSLEEVFHRIPKHLEELLVFDDKSLRTTEKGMNILDSICVDLLCVLNDFFAHRSKEVKIS